MRKWRAEHPEESRACVARYRVANSEMCAARVKRWIANNYEHFLTTVKAWSKAHPEKCRESVKRWRSSHPKIYREQMRRSAHVRRSRKYGNMGNESVTREHLSLILLAQDGRCRYCNQPLDDDRHLDHRTPLSRGGPHAPHNVCWSCPRCNLSKKSLTEAEFLVRCA